jgi:hypothetical protein
VQREREAGGTGNRKVEEMEGRPIRNVSLQKRPWGSLSIKFLKPVGLGRIFLSQKHMEIFT